MATVSQIRAGLFVLLLCTAAPSAAGAAESAPDCLPKAMVADILQNDLPGATAIAKLCVEEDARVSALYPSGAGISSGDLIAVLTLSYYQCAASQLAAQSGDLKAAKAYLADAEASSGARASYFDSVLVTDWKGILDVTRGFVAEKSGDLNAAKSWYGGHPGGYAAIRLAELALQDSRLEDARAIANTMGTNPNRWIVLGALAEAGSDNAQAAQDYETAIRLMHQEASGNNFMPVAYFGIARAQSGLLRVRGKASNAPSH